MTSRPGQTITYNYDNMPSSINGMTFVYDYSGQRVKKNGTVYIGKLYECSGGVCTKHIFAGGNRIASKRGSQYYFYHTDHLGSSTVVTDIWGNKVQENYYYPFGGTRDGSGYVTDYKFTGQEEDEETGLYYYGARYYDPAIGRFISADSIVQAPFDPQTLNRYSYCRNNPIIYTDPSGNIFGLGILESIIFGAIIGGSTSAATGGDVGIGMLTGAISGAIFFGAGEIISGANSAAQLSAMDAFYSASSTVSSGVSSVGQAAIHAGAGAVSGGINAGISGDNIGMGMLAGGISGGIAKYAGGRLPKGFGYQLAGRSLIGGVTGGITAEIYGGEFGQGFSQGAMTGAAGFLFNDCRHGECSSWLEKLSNAAAGFGDTVSLGGTKAIRAYWAANLDWVDPTNYDSGAYTAGEVGGYVLDVATGTAGAARAVGWTTRIAVHEAHHTFGSLGKLSHIQMNYWRIGVKGSGGVFRIPLPWR